MHSKGGDENDRNNRINRINSCLEENQIRPMVYRTVQITQSRMNIAAFFMSQPLLFILVTFAINNIDYGKRDQQTNQYLDKRQGS